MIYWGTCSWKYNSWYGLVYSQPKTNNHLKEYVQHFNSVEVDQWFWSLFGIDKVKLPSPKTVEEYAQAVKGHPDFKFSVKVPNSITLTHFYRKNKAEPLRANPYFLSEQLFLDFLHLLEPLWPNLGPLMFQFEYLNIMKMSGLPRFLDMMGSFLEKLPKEFQYGIEIRNPNYLRSEFFRFLRDHSVSMVFLEGYYMPPIAEVYRKIRQTTSNIREIFHSPVVFRLHGPSRDDIEVISGEIWNKIYVPQDDSLQSISQIIRELLEADIEVYVNANNHYEGSAPLTISRLKELLQA
ncbi:MAG: DUF72 domain-containing protein [Calditrichia bacterium]